MAKSKAANESEPVVIKKYANRRLYNTETSSYITLDLLSQMTREGREFVVVDVCLQPTNATLRQASQTMDRWRKAITNLARSTRASRA